MTLAAHVLRDDGLRATGTGFEVDVRLNWYRSLPLSSLETLELTVNGETISRDEITLSVNGEDYALDDLSARCDDMWFVLDPATLRVSRPLVRAGEAAEIRLALGNRIPYLLVGPGRAFEYVTDRTATVVARPAT
jgi:Domain of unknown function (DUF6379)